MTETDLFLSIYSLFSSHPILSYIAVFCARWLPYITCAFIIIQQVSFSNYKKSAKKIFTIFTPPFLATCLGLLIKYFSPALRPYAVLDIHPLVSGLNPFGSFPSLHAAFFAALAISMFVHNPKEGKYYFIIAIIIAFARIAVGVHWPHDVLAGFLFGYFIGLLWSISDCTDKK